MLRTEEQAKTALECIRLAVQGTREWIGPADIVEAAEQYLAFVTGVSPKSPRETILDALDAAGV